MMMACISLGTLIGSTIRIVIVQHQTIYMYRHAYAPRHMCTCSSYNYTVKTDRCISLETMNRALSRKNSVYRCHRKTCRPEIVSRRQFFLRKLCRSQLTKRPYILMKFCQEILSLDMELIRHTLLLAFCCKQTYIILFVIRTKETVFEEEQNDSVVIEVLRDNE